MDHEKELKLLKENFPDVTCFCELCDCGRHRHHKDCKKVRKQRSPTKYQPKTDYQETFKAYRFPKPRSSKRPAPDRRIVPPPLDGRTWQREQFKPIDVEKHARPPAFHKNEDYVEPSVPFHNQTTNSTVYKPQPYEKVEHVPPKPATFQITKPGRFQTTTTNDEFFRDWQNPRQQVSFTEPPSFMQSMLFPTNKQEEVKSWTRYSYPGVTGRKAEPAKVPEGNIHVGEGDHDHLTVNRDVYRGQFGERSHIITHTPELGKIRRASFYGETQNNRDFRTYGPNAGRRMPAQPAPDTIDLKFDNRRSFETEQRKIYKGHDTRVHVAPMPARKEFGEYQKPTVAFETKTTQKTDFIPKDINEASQERAKMPESKLDTGGKFYSETAYGHYYRDWKDTRLPQRYGDFVDGINSMYLPPVQKFAATTTTCDEFQPKTTEMRPNMKPKPEPIDKQGNHDFNTVNRLTYKGHNPPMCRAEAYLLQQELKRRLAEDGVDASELAKGVRPGQGAVKEPVFIC